MADRMTTSGGSETPRERQEQAQRDEEQRRQRAEREQHQTEPTPAATSQGQPSTPQAGRGSRTPPPSQVGATPANQIIVQIEESMVNVQSLTMQMPNSTELAQFLQHLVQAHLALEQLRAATQETPTTQGEESASPQG